MMDLASENGFRVKKDFEKSSNIVTRICAKNGKKKHLKLRFWDWVKYVRSVTSTE